MIRSGVASRCLQDCHFLEILPSPFYHIPCVRFRPMTFRIRLKIRFALLCDKHHIWRTIWNSYFFSSLLSGPRVYFWLISFLTCYVLNCIYFDFFFFFKKESLGKLLYLELIYSFIFNLNYLFIILLRYYRFNFIHVQSTSV